LTELLVELSSEVEHVMGALTMTKSASDIVVERGICEPMQRSEAARHGWVEGLLGGGVLAPMRAVSRLSERKVVLGGKDSQAAVKSKKGVIQPSQHNDIRTCLRVSRSSKLRKGRQMGSKQM